MKKRVLSLLMALVLCLTLLPTAAAATTEKATHGDVEQTVPVYFNTATTYTYDVKTDLLDGLELTNASYAITGDIYCDSNWIDGSVKLSGSELTFTSKSASDPEADVVLELYITVKSDNYEDFCIYLTGKAGPKREEKLATSRVYWKYGEAPKDPKEGVDKVPEDAVWIRTTYMDLSGKVIEVPTNAGEYKYKVEYESVSTHYVGEGPLDIEAVVVFLSSVDIANTHTTYNGDSKSPQNFIEVTATVNGAKRELKAGTDFSVSGETGAYSVKKNGYQAQLKLCGNYTAVPDDPKEFTWYIDPMEAELELVNADGRKYGDGLGNVTMRVKNAVSGIGGSVTVSYDGGENLSVGDHTVTATALNNENYKLPDDGSNRTLTYHVAKGEETLQEADITMNGWIYGQDPTTPSVANLPEGVTPTFTYQDLNGAPFTPAKTTDAGVYTVTVRAETDDTVYIGTKQFTVARKTLTADDIGEYGPSGIIPNKTYDGSTGFPLTGLGTKKTSLVGALGADDVLYIGGTSEFAGTNAGDTELIFTTNGKLSTFPGGAVKPGNYTIAKGLTKPFAARIDPRWLDFTVDSVSKRYGSDTADVRVTFTSVAGNNQSGLVDGEQLTQGVDYDVTATFSQTTIGQDDGVVVTVTLKDTAKAKNYRLVSSQTVTTGTITKAAAPNVPEQTVEIYSNAETRYPIDLTKGWPAGKPTIFDYDRDGRNSPYLEADELSDLLYRNASYMIPAPDEWNGTIYINAHAFTADIGTDLGVLKVVLKSANYDDLTLRIRFKVKAKAQETLNVDLEGWTYGETANPPAYTTPAGAKETTLTYTSRDGQTDYGSTPPTNAGDYTLTVRCEGIDTIWTGSAEFNIAKKQIAPPAADPASFTYTASEQTYTLAPNAAYTISPNTTQTNAGSYTITVSLNDTANTEWTDGATAAKEYTFTISAAKLTVTALDKRITAGQSAPDLTTPVLGEDYKVDGLLGQDALTAVTLAYGETPDTSKAGSYAINISAVQTNYDITTVPGTLTIAPRPSSGGSTTYPVNTPSKTENGSVSVSPKNASKGSTVTITVKPDSGYQLDDLDVTDKDGNELKLTDKGNGQYTFTMPAGKVSVEASFIKAAETSFVDVPANAYFADAVKWAVDKGVTNGLTDTMFGPYESCTRAQIVTFLWRAAGSPEPKAMSSFTDVPASAYYAKAVAWAVENGITNGMTETTFAPDAICARGQSVTFLYRALKGTASGSTSFTDVPADAFYADAVNWAVANNVTNGTSATTFSPNADCTRAEIVTFLYRAYQGK